MATGKSWDEVRAQKPVDERAGEAYERLMEAETPASDVGTAECPHRLDRRSPGLAGRARRPLDSWGPTPAPRASAHLSSQGSQALTARRGFAVWARTLPTARSRCSVPRSPPPAIPI